MPSTSRSLVCLLLAQLLAQLGLSGCRAVEDPEPLDQPPPRSTPLRISTEPLGTVVRLPDFASVAREVGPSVVGVISTIESEAGRLKGVGSGLIVSSRGQRLATEDAVR